MPTPTFYRRLLLLCLGAAIIYLAGNWAFALFDRDEGWYAQISRQMVQSGDWVVPRFMNDVFEGKPVLAFWCQAASMSLFGDTSFAARLPSALSTVLLLFILGIAIGKTAGRTRALWTVAILATAGLLIALSKMCLTDAPLLLWITLSQLCLYAIYRKRGGWLAVILFWAFVGLAILTKGPVIIGVLGGTLLALALLDIGAQWRSPRAWLNSVIWWYRAHPWFGIFIVILVVGPWTWLVQHRSPAFLGATLQDSMFGPIFRAPLEGHAGWPGYYLSIIWAVWMPWSLLLPLAIHRGWTNRRLAPIRFALAAVIGPWLVIECVKQKLPHYLLPMFPALAFVTADAVVRCLRGQYADLKQRSMKLGAAVWTIAVILVSLSPFAAAWPSLGLRNLPWVQMSLMAAYGLAISISVWILFYRQRIAAALCSIAGGMALWAILLFTMIFPHLDYLRLSPRIAEILRREGAAAPGDVGMIEHRKLGYDEPSLAFYQGGNYLRLGDGSSLIAQSQGPRPHWILATAKIYEQLPNELRDQLKPVETIRGWAIGGSGRLVDVMILRRQSAPTDRTSAAPSPANSLVNASPDH